MGEKIDINSASAAELEQGLVGVGRRRAQAIVRRRKEIGGFESVEELTRVRGIGAWVQEMNHEVLTCRSSSGAGPAPGTERRRRANGLPRRRRDEVTGRLQVEEEEDEEEDENGEEPDEEEGEEDYQGDAEVEDQQEEGEGDGLEEAGEHYDGEHNQAVDDNVAREQNNFKPVPGPAVFGHASAIYDGDEMMEDEDDDEGDDEEEEEEGGSAESDEGTEAVMSYGRESASSGITFKQALAHVRQQMKRKSEHGPDMRALSPGKKPCKGSEHPSHAFGSLLPCTSAPPTFGELRAASGQGQSASRRRLAGVQPPPELQDWLKIFQRWSGPERLLALDELIDRCEPTQVKHVMQVIEPQFQRDFISLLPKELALYVLSFLEPRDLLRAAQTCRYWRVLAEDNLLWREKCREEGLEQPLHVKRRKATTPNFTYSPWKSAYMRQHRIDMNWRCGEIKPPKVLKGHDDHVITCLQFCGNRIVSGSDDNTLKVWSAINGKCLRTLVGHTGGVWSSQMRGNTIVSGSTDRTLKVWNADTGQCVYTLYGHTSTVRCMHLHSNRVVSGSRDATLRVWDIETGLCLHVLMGHVAAVRCVQFDGRRVVSGAYDYTVKVWDPETETCLHTLQGHTNRVYSLQFDGTHIVSGSLDTSIRVWDAETGTCLHTLVGHQSLTSGMELRDNILVSGNADSTVKIWDIKTGQCLQTLQGPNKHQSAVTCLQFSRKLVVTSSDDGTVKLWDLRTGEFLRNLVTLESGGSGGVVWRVRCSNTKLVCAVGSRNGTEETKLLVLDFDVDAK